MHTEQSVLRTSIAVTLFVAGFGIAFGLLSGSFSIAFDGIYSLADASMTMLALVISRLITTHSMATMANKRLKERFTRGFWHLEPLVLSLNGILLMGVSSYAFINAVGSLFSGGRELAFGYAIFYAVITLITCITMAYYGHKTNKSIRSALVALDVKAWIMSGGITFALLIAFSIGIMVDGTSLNWVSPYIDPAVLILVCLFIIPIPISTVRRSLSDILLITPEILKNRVDDIARSIVEKYEFLSFRSYVARIGRSRQIELYFIVPPGLPAKTLEEWDHIRDDIGEAIGNDGPDRWLTIVFTADKEWAE